MCKQLNKFSFCLKKNPFRLLKSWFFLASWTEFEQGGPPGFTFYNSLMMQREGTLQSSYFVGGDYLQPNRTLEEGSECSIPSVYEYAVLILDCQNVLRVFEMIGSFFMFWIKAHEMGSGMQVTGVFIFTYGFRSLLQWVIMQLWKKARSLLAFPSHHIKGYVTPPPPPPCRPARSHAAVKQPAALWPRSTNTNESGSKQRLRQI